MPGTGLNTRDTDKSKIKTPFSGGSKYIWRPSIGQQVIIIVTRQCDGTVIYGTPTSCGDRDRGFISVWLDQKMCFREGDA